MKYFFSSNSSKKTKRLIKRGGKDYYEYRDTVITNNSPFKPEWIRELCFVSNNNPNNKMLEWNKGHLLHQLTYFVGKVNFYFCMKLNSCNKQIQRHPPTHFREKSHDDEMK